MRKIIITTLSILVSIIAFAQTPNAIKYQTVVRDGAGAVLNNQTVDFQISILETSASGSAIYVETFSTATNQFGLVNLEIGTGTVGSGTFSTINWAGDLHFVKVEVDINDGNGLQNMGTSQLLSVPYALNAKSAENVDLGGDVSGNAGANTVEKIQGLEVSTNTPANGQVLKWDASQSKWIPNDDALGAAGSTDGVVSYMGITGSTTKTITLDRTNSLGQLTASFIDNINDADHSITNEIQDLQLTGNTLKITNNGSATNIDLSGYANLWQESSNNIYYNGGNVGVGVNNPTGKLIVKADAGMHMDTAIFEVKNKNGKTIFAVYEEGVRIYVDDSGTKANSSKAGFAVGGFNATKALTNNYFVVSPDSIRAYIESGSGSSKAGFAVGGFNATKTIPDVLFNIGASDSDTINPSEARIAWYPTKEAFMAGRIFVESADSVGLNSFATGNISQALGDYSQAFGDHARAKGHNSTAIGTYANAVDSGSYAIGSGATASGLRSFALGSVGVDSAGNSTGNTIASGDFSYAFGMGALAKQKGAFSIGTNTDANGKYSLAMGYESKTDYTYGVAIGYKNYSLGYQSVAIGNNNTSEHRAFSFGSNNRAEQQTMVMGFGAAAEECYYGYALSIGINTIARQENTMALGFHNITKTEYETVVGRYNDTVPVTYYPPLFTIGNGVSSTSRHNAVTVLQNGYMGLGTKSASQMLDIYGSTPNIEITNTQESEAGIIFNDAQVPTTQYAKILYDCYSNEMNFYNGNTTSKLNVTTTGVQVGNGSTIRKVQHGSYNAGTGSGGVKTVTINYPSSFAGIPKVIVTIKGGNYDDVFAITTRQVTSTQFKVNIYRVDSAGGIWAQNLYLDWVAIY